MHSRERAISFLQVPALELLAKIFERDITDECRDNRDGEIGNTKDVVKGKSQRLAVTVGRREFTHKQVRVKQKDDKGDLDHRPPDRGETLPVCSLRPHGTSIVTRVEPRLFALAPTEQARKPV